MFVRAMLDPEQHDHDHVDDGSYDEERQQQQHDIDECDSNDDVAVAAEADDNRHSNVSATAATSSPGIVILTTTPTRDLDDDDYEENDDDGEEEDEEKHQCIDAHNDASRGAPAAGERKKQQKDLRWSKDDVATIFQDKNSGGASSTKDYNGTVILSPSNNNKTPEVGSSATAIKTITSTGTERRTLAAPSSGGSTSLQPVFLGMTMTEGTTFDSSFEEHHSDAVSYDHKQQQHGHDELKRGGYQDLTVSQIVDDDELEDSEAMTTKWETYDVLEPVLSFDDTMLEEQSQYDEKDTTAVTRRRSTRPPMAITRRGVVELKDPPNTITHDGQDDADVVSAVSEPAATPDNYHKTLWTITYISLFAIMGTVVRVYLGRFFGGDCESDGGGDETDVDGLASFFRRICVTSSGSSSTTQRQQQGGALFIDLPANVVGTFIMGMLSPSIPVVRKKREKKVMAHDDGHGHGRGEQKRRICEVRIPWLNVDHPLQIDDAYISGLKVGLCGCITTYASWNTQMIIMLEDGTASQIISAIFGYFIGMACASYAFMGGRHTYRWLTLSSWSCCCSSSCSWWCSSSSSWWCSSMIMTMRMMMQSTSSLSFHAGAETTDGAAAALTSGGSHNHQPHSHPGSDHDHHEAHQLRNDDVKQQQHPERQYSKPTTELPSSNPNKQQNEMIPLSGEDRVAVVAVGGAEQQQQHTIVDDKNDNVKNNSNPPPTLSPFMMAAAAKPKADNGLQQQQRENHSKDIWKTQTTTTTQQRSRFVPFLVSTIIVMVLLGLFLYNDIINDNDDNNKTSSAFYRTMWLSCLFSPLGAISRWRLSEQWKKRKAMMIMNKNKKKKIVIDGNGKKKMLMIVKDDSNNLMKQQQQQHTSHWYFCQLSSCLPTDNNNNMFLLFIPWGTFIANMLAAIISIFAEAIIVRYIDNNNSSNSGEEEEDADTDYISKRWMKPLLSAIKTGFAGCLSTVSTFIRELFHDMSSQQPEHACIYTLITITCSMILGILIYSPIVRSTG